MPLSWLVPKNWTILCQTIQGGNEQTLSDLVCGCCGSESLFAGMCTLKNVLIFCAHCGIASGNSYVAQYLNSLLLNKLFSKTAVRDTIHH